MGTNEMTSLDTKEFDELKRRGLNLRPLWRTIQRNLLLITGFTTVVAAAALYSSIKSPHSYEGGFQILVEPVTSEAKLTDPSVLARDGASPNYANDDSFYPSLIYLLKSNGLLSVIAKRIQTQYPDVSQDSLSKDLLVQRIGEDRRDWTKIIEVRYTGGSPEKVQLVLEELAKGYLKYSLDDRKTRINGGVQFIDNQIPGLQQRVNSLRLQLQALQQRYKMIDTDVDGAALSKQVHETEAQKLEAQRQLEEQRRLYTNLQRQLGLSPNEALAASTLSEDPNYQNILEQLTKIESQIATDLARFKEENPSIQKLRQQQKNLTLLLNQETRRILGQSLLLKTENSQVLSFQNPTRLVLIKQLVDAANQVQVLKVRSQKFAQTEAVLNQQVQQLPDAMRQYNDIQERLEVATKTLNQLLLQREGLRVEAAQKELPWQVISEPKLQMDATGSPVPIPRGTAKNLAMGLIAGFVLGLGIAVIKEKYRNVFYTIEDIQDAIKLPILGAIPFNKSAKQFSNSSTVVGSIEGTGANRSDASLFLEAFNSIYASIRFFTSAQSVQSLVVSSAAPGDGKTTVALYLAQAAAAMGKRVLLVDANLRLPQLHTRLDVSNLQGLSNLLSQDLNPNDLIQQSPLRDNLFVLTSGQLLPDSARLLASHQMQYLMEQFQTAFDLVIYDTPHLLGLADATFLASHTNGLLMVVGVGKTNHSVVMQVLNGLNAFHLPVLGIIANHFEESKNSSYGYYDRYYAQNHPAHPTVVEKSKISKTDLLISAQKHTDNGFR